MLDPSIPYWPRQLAPQQVARRRIHPVNMGPEPIGGAPQSVASDAGRWGINFNRVMLYGVRILTFRAIIGARCAPLQPIYVPMRDYCRTPRFLAQAAFAAGLGPAGPFSDGSFFSDGTGFIILPVDFKVTHNAAARATALTITSVAPAGVSLQAGQFVGLVDRSYLVTSLVPSADGIANHYDVQIWPPLRAAAAAGDAINTEDPIVKSIVDPRFAELSEDLDLDRIGVIDVPFQESRW